MYVNLTAPPLSLSGKKGYRLRKTAEKAHLGLILDQTYTNECSRISVIF